MNSPHPPSSLNRKAILALIGFGVFQGLFFLTFFSRNYFLERLPQPFGRLALLIIATSLLFLCLATSLSIGAAIRQRAQLPTPTRTSAYNPAPSPSTHRTFLLLALLMLLLMGGIVLFTLVILRANLG